MEHLNPTNLEKFAFDFFRELGVHTTFNGMSMAAQNEFPNQAEISRESAILAYYDAKTRSLQSGFEAQLKSHADELVEVQSVQSAAQ